MKTLFIQETFTNETENYRFGESDVYETGYSTVGELFRAVRREYGRCISRVYVDRANDAKPIGWVFERRAKYDDCNQTYLQHTWVTIHDALPTKTVKYHYAELSNS